MRCYLASTVCNRWCWGGAESCKKKVTGAHLLESFYYADEVTEWLIEAAGSFMLDSGAFSFLKGNAEVSDIDGYVERYADFIGRNDIELFFELDIDPIIGYDGVCGIRHRLEELTGKQPIPVWHKSRGADEFIRMCDEYPYVAIGGIVSKEIKRKEWPAMRVMIREAHKRGCKIHGLGFTDVNQLATYHFDSVDSTSWLSGNQFGHLCQFDGKTMRQVKKPDGMKFTDQGAVAMHNFGEWLKFSKYAEEAF